MRRSWSGACGQAKLAERTWTEAVTRLRLVI